MHIASSLDSTQGLSSLLSRWQSLSASPALAVLDAAGSVSFQAAAQRSRQLAIQLQAGGLGGCRIGLSSTPDRNWLEAFWAILLVGGSVVPISPLHPPPERAFFLGQSGARAHLVSSSLAANMAEGPVPRLVFDAGHLLTPAAALAMAEQVPSPEHAAGCALLLYTSGTTGLPKGVPLGHDQVWSCVQTLIADWGMSPADRLIHALPLHHVHGICVALLCAFCAGASTELLPRYEPGQILGSAARASVLMSVPTQHKRLVDYLHALPEPERQQHAQALRALRLITSGSAKLPEQLGCRLQALSGQYPLERYGMTEVGIVIGNPLHGGRKPGSCGRPLPNSEIRIVDEQGRDVAAGQSGEIRIRGGSVFQGYDRDPTATLAAFDSGFFKTGDTARWTPDGFVQILGRTSVDIIKSGGYKLSAIEIEEQLRAHPWVQDVAVLGVPDETWGERAVAVAVPAPAARAEIERRGSTAGQEVRDWLKQRVAGYQVPKQIEWRAELPRNAMGKVQKSELLKLLLSGS
jgi:malonyl-CoA/methylmalonyl-CoA synthetase